MDKPCSGRSDCRRRGRGLSRATSGFVMGQRKVEDVEKVNLRVLGESLVSVQGGTERPGCSAVIAVR